MKNLIQLISLILIVSVTACSTIEDQAPLKDSWNIESLEQRTTLDITTVNIELDNTNGQGFNLPIDINGNGTVDFYFKAEPEWLSSGLERTVEKNYMQQSTVRMESAQLGNEITSQATFTRFVCSNYIDFTPVHVLTAGTMLNEHHPWATDPILHVRILTIDDCYYHAEYVKDNSANVIGVRFMDYGEVYYGWIQVKPHPTKTSQQGPTIWTITKYAYNSIPGEGFVIH